MAATGQFEVPIVPEEIARAAILPASYADMDGVVHPAHRWLRENLPVARIDLEGYDPVWLITKHADCRAVLRDAALFHNADVNIMLLPQAGDEWLRRVLGGHTKVIEDLSYQEPPCHTRLRAAIGDDFLPAQVLKFMPRFREIAKDAVDRLLDEHPDGECDFVELTAVFPLEVVMELLGVPPEDYAYMLKLTRDAFGGDDPDERREGVPSSPQAMAIAMHQGMTDARRYFDELRKDRQARPRDDIATSIYTARLGSGEEIPPKILNDLTLGVALAGEHTTNYTISGAMHGLCTFPEQFKRVKSDPGLIPGLVAEAARWATPVRHLTRNATAQADVGGMPIAPGDRLMVLFVSANRDADVFDRPGEFDVTRWPNRHLAFSAGPHVCIGQHIAKYEMRAFWEELIPRLRSVELAGAPVLRSSNFIGGFKHLPIRFTRA